MLRVIAHIMYSWSHRHSRSCVNQNRSNRKLLNVSRLLVREEGKFPSMHVHVQITVCSMSTAHQACNARCMHALKVPQGKASTAVHILLAREKHEYLILLEYSLNYSRLEYSFCIHHLSSPVAHPDTMHLDP